MFEQEISSVIQVTKDLGYLKKISPSGRGDMLIARLEQWLLNDPSFINEVQVLSADIIKLENKLSLLEKQLILARSMVQSTPEEHVMPLTFIQKLKLSVLG